MMMKIGDETKTVTLHEVATELADVLSGERFRSTMIDSVEYEDERYLNEKALNAAEDALEGLVAEVLLNLTHSATFPVLG